MWPGLDMANYRYKAFDGNGAIVSGAIEAGSSKEALDRLVGRGLTPFEATISGAANAAQRTSNFRLSKRVPLSFYAGFTRQMATLLEAEIPIDQVLKFLASGSAPGKFGVLSAKLHERITSGMPLSKALEIEAGDVPLFLSNLVKAGEARGNLAGTFSELADFIEARVALTDKIKSTLTYPLILAVSAVATLIIVITVLVPALMPLFDDAGTPPPAALAVLNRVSTAIAAHWVEIVLVLALVALLVRSLFRSEKIRYALDVFALKIPVLGDYRRQTSSALFAHTLGALLRSGLALVPALEIASSVLSNRVFGSAVRSAKVRVEEGSKMSAALREAGPFPDLVIQLISVGEESGKLDQTLTRLAKMLDSENEKKIEAGMALVAPLLTVAIGLGVGGLILSVMRAMLSVNELVFK